MLGQLNSFSNRQIKFLETRASVCISTQKTANGRRDFSVNRSRI